MARKNKRIKNKNKRDFLLDIPVVFVYGKDKEF